MKYSLLLLASLSSSLIAEPKSFSGVFPHLAHTNEEGEVGIGAVVPWAGSLWTNTYGPHLPYGSSDKLRQIDKNWNLTIRPESVGGTPANRMIHPESNQLFIGHHVIDAKGKVRTIDPKVTMPGRLTATARHLSDPTNKIYHFTMEDGLYEVDVKSLEVKNIIRDPGNITKTHLPGYHGKGAYTGSGRLVISNNGEPNQTFPSGCLASWDGHEWTVIARNQFVEVTGPGGLSGNSPGDDRLWATGWDQKSVRLFLLEDGEWFKFRLPKGSYTQDAAHGWNTEWPRIRQLADDHFLGHMHGWFFEFPKSFSKKQFNGIKPLGTYTKMPVDYALFNGQLVIGKDDASLFDNAFTKQAQSNLWIGDYKELSQWGPKSGFGGVWLDDSFDAGQASEPFFIGGFQHRQLHFRHLGAYAVRISIQCDPSGSGNWQEWKQLSLAKHQTYQSLSLDDAPGEWVRLVALDALDRATAYFHLSSEYLKRPSLKQFDALAEVTAAAPIGSTLQLPKGLDMRLDCYRDDQLLTVSGELKVSNTQLNNSHQATAKAIAIQESSRIGLDDASVFIQFKDANGIDQKLRLPKGHAAFDATINKVRHIREIVTERTHMNLHGTFYELPRPKPGSFINFWQMKPISSHQKHIHDFSSWRGLLVFSGAKPNAKSPQSIALDAKESLWLGEIDELWKFGKPVGQGGPWLKTSVQRNVPSDPYLMLGYEHKSLRIEHNDAHEVNVDLEIDFLGTGQFSTYQRFTIPAGKPLEFTFPKGFAAHWLRLVPKKSCTATAQLQYS